jgi:NADH-quinone oxidoreductase subunit G
VIPTLTVFEKNGTLVNQQFRLQRFAKAVPGAEGAVDDLSALSALAAAAGAAAPGADLGSVWAAIAAEVPALAGLSYSAVPDAGLPIDSGRWSALPFAEGPGLHFKPSPPAPREAAHA